MQLGFIGLKFSGKSTLFELLTQGKYESVHSGMADYRRGQVIVPDERVERLSKIYQPKKTTYAHFDCIDVMGLPAGMRSDQAAKYLEAVRQTDSLVAVIQVFEGYDSEGRPFRIDPVKNLEELEADLIFADLIVAETRLEKVKHLKARSASQFDPKELELLEKCRLLLEENKPLRDVHFSDSEDKRIRGFQFLSKKPLMAVLNCDESHYDKRKNYEINFKDSFPEIPVTSVSALTEKEIQELDEDERALFMEELGIDEPAINHVISTSYSALDLSVSLPSVRTRCAHGRCFPAPQHPMLRVEIHSDLQKGFIRAEVVSYDDLIREGSFANAKSKGLVRLEGKDYVVKDGDILNIRFNV
ncbi:MAG: DUF933 domain-containing protein [Candidatus Marinimicrobia bacterium]|nr:DUF933 domain-containing protein [Candidatus Neomarinimicrobiota bacterium]